MKDARSMVSVGAVTLVVALGSCSEGTSDPDADPSPSVPSSSTTRTFAEAEAATRDAVDVFGGSVPGIMVTVRVGEETATITGGFADVDKQRPMREHSRLQIGSITKAMVATLVMQLVESGQIGLEDTVESRLPGLVPAGDRITVDMLLSHRSGLPNSTDLEDPPLDPYSPRTMVRAAVKQLPPVFEPGESWSYSNTNYDVLALLLEEDSGKALDRLLRRRVLGPAAMTESTLGSAGAPADSLAHGYFNSEDVTIDPLPPLAAGGIVSTSSDVDRFLTALFAGQLVGADQLAAMTSARAHVHGDDYGYGLFSRDLGCGTAWGHDGSIDGFSSLALRIEELDESVVVLVNDVTSGSYLESIAIAALCG